MHSLENK